ncbi:hypothetical protein Anapl_00418 [Anas platyrhynchos]|uniref:Uncharacterized protein n=1 Tax=Anas platyrhynchos TaxID=8839 RepID=R0JV30_ANAPL|nr:hypothetical protein Anapl_00418 [Anas platyrhynchos]
MLAASQSWRARCAPLRECGWRVIHLIPYVEGKIVITSYNVTPGRRPWCSGGGMCEDEGWSLLAAGAATGAKLYFGCEAGGPGAGPEPQPVAPYSACWCHTEPRQVGACTDSTYLHLLLQARERRSLGLAMCRLSFSLRTGSCVELRSQLVESQLKCSCSQAWLQVLRPSSRSSADRGVLPLSFGYGMGYFYNTALEKHITGINEELRECFSSPTRGGKFCLVWKTGEIKAILLKSSRAHMATEHKKKDKRLEGLPCNCRITSGERKMCISGLTLVQHSILSPVWTAADDRMRYIYRCICRLGLLIFLALVTHRVVAS